MAEANADNLIPADEEIEGEREPTEDFVFVRIGKPLPLKVSDSAFDLQNPPSQPLAISHRRRLLLVAHSEGFFVAKTDDVIKSAREIKEKGKGPSVEGASIVDVKIGRVSILSLSEDEETLAAAVGGEIFFFSTLSLLKKEQEPSFSHSVTNSGMVKDFKWQKNIGKYFLVLSSHGSLYCGTKEGQLKAVMEDVDAVDWSRDGDFVAVARKHTITILSSSFKELLSLSLFFQSWPPTESGCKIKVDSIKWVRDDSIIIGSFQVNEDGEEEGYLIQIITSKENKFSEMSCKPIVYSFPDIFEGVWDVLPNGRGPYLITSTLDYWEIVLASNQKTIDQHMMLFKYSKDTRGEVVLLDITNDKYRPKIDLQENGDDNLLLGLVVDKFSSFEKIMIQSAAECKELPSRCALLCLTSEGKLILYQAARISEPSDLPQKPFSLDDDNVVKEKHFMPSSSEQSTTRLELKDDVDGADSEYRLKLINVEPLNSDEGPTKLGGETVTPKRRQDGGASQVGYFTGQVGHLKKSSGEAPVISQPGLAKRGNAGSGVHMFGKPSARAEISTPVTESKTSEAAAAVHANAKNGEFKDAGEGIFRPNITTAPFDSQATGRIFGTDVFSAQPSTFSSSTPVSNIQEKTKLDNFSSGFQSSNQSFDSRGLTKQPALTMFSSGQTNPNSWPRTGDAELTFTAPSSIVHAQESLIPGKVNYSKASSLFENIRVSKSPQALNSEPEISKQFYNVKNMAQELDILLSNIEKEGGFRDACTIYQKSSLLALETGLEALSERSHECRKNVEEQLMGIQQLQNKMLQVSARQVYMKGIVEQASDRKYWEIWNRQKLNPELEAKWRNILNANQNLTNHIIELERHFNTLEISRFGGSGRISPGQSVPQSGYYSSRQNQSLQSVYTTLNSQLTAAEHLSKCLSEQMSELNINCAPLKRQSKKKELFESIGLSPEGSALESPDFKKLIITPNSVRRTPSSTASSIWKGASSMAKAPEPETGRRRRDSLDRNWTTFEPPKTTVKRIVQERRSRVSADEPFRKAKHVFNSQLEAFTMQQKRNAANISSSQYILSEGMQDSVSKQAFEARPNSFSRLAKDFSNSSETLGSISYSMSGMQRTGSLPPLMPQALSTFSSFSGSMKEVSGSPDISSSKATKPWSIPDSSANKTVSSSSITSNKQFEASNSIQTSLTFGGSFSPINTRTTVEASDKAIKNLKPSEGTSPARSLSTFSSESIYAANGRNTIASPALTSSGLSTVQLNISTWSSQSSESTTTLQSHLKSSVPTPSLSVPFSYSTSPAAASSKAFLTPASKATISFGKSSLGSEPAGTTNQTATGSTSTSASDSQSLPSSMISSGLQYSVIPTSTAVTPTKTFGTSSSSTDAKRKGELNQMASAPIPTSAASSSSLSLSSSISQFSQSQKLSSTSPPERAALQSPTGSDRTAPVTSTSPDSFNLDKVSAQSQPATTQSSISEQAECTPRKEDNVIGKTGDNVTLPTSNSQLEAPSPMAPVTSGTTTEKDGALDTSLSQEDEMEEEAPDTTAVLSLGTLGGFGFGSTPSTPKPNPFGGSFLTANSGAASSPVSFPASSPGEPFRPASFTLPSAHPAQPASSGGFSSGFGGGFSGFGQPSQVGVGQQAQAGVGQQALGSVLGSFGQSRQLGTGMPGVGFPSSSAFSGGGFSAVGGFASAGAGGFASVGSAGGGFAAASRGGGFAAVSSTGGFAGAGAAAGGGFGAVSSTGGFAGAGAGAGAGGGFGSVTPTAGFGAVGGGGGFGAAATGGGFASGGFAGFGSNQGGAFSAFGGNNSSGAGKPPAELLTQMRK